MAVLKLGAIDLWRPPIVTYELVGARPNYTKTACGSVLDSTDLTYRLFLGHMCTLAAAQELEIDIREELAAAPNLTLTRQETPDALVFQNMVKSGELNPSTDQTELRARFTRNRVLAFQLVLTLSPTESGLGNMMYRQGRYLAATGAFDWVNDDIKALLFTASSTAPSELYVNNIADFVDLSEPTGVTGYARVAVTGREVNFGSSVELIADDLLFVAMDDADEEITGALIYQDNGAGDGTSYPLFLIGVTPYNPGGGVKTIPLVLAGIF